MKKLKSYTLRYARVIILEAGIEAASQEEAEQHAMDMELAGELGLTPVGDGIEQCGAWKPEAGSIIVDIQDDEFIWQVDCDESVEEED